MYQDGSSPAECLPCEAGTFGGTFSGGTFTPAEGLGTCTACPGGYYQPGLPAGTVIGDTDYGPPHTQCWGCSYGRYSTEGDPAGCQRCPAGTVGPYERLAQCINCPNGKYQPEEGAVQCVSCVAGRFATATEPSIDCTLCPVGKFQPLPDPNGVDPDGPEPDPNNLAQSSCNDCALGSQTEDSDGDFVRLGAVTCDVCESGRFLGLNVDQTDPGFAGCVACDVGQFQDETGQVACEPCGAGQYQPTPGQTGCIGCDAGSQTEGDGQLFTDSGAVACRQCGRGRSAGVDVNGAPDPTLACAECAPGHYQDQYGATECKGCPAGRVVNVYGSD
eukprot:COSAG02_NODE_12565_length_1524_cov_1.419649_1_plen_330_part_01